MFQVIQIVGAEALQVKECIVFCGVDFSGVAAHQLFHIFRRNGGVVRAGRLLGTQGLVDDGPKYRVRYHITERICFRGGGRCG